MELILFNSVNFHKDFGCQGIHVDEIPLSERRQVIAGSALVAIYVVFEALWIPCLWALFLHRNDNSCYALMFATGIVDAVTLNLIALLTGLLAAFGVVFCEQQTLIYVVGCLLEALWAIQTDLNVILALNRCVECLAPHLADTLFKGYRTWLWIAAVALHYVAFAANVSIIFCPMQISWFYNPYTGYRDDPTSKYFYKMDLAQNYVVFILLPAIYVTFSVVLFVQTSVFKKIAHVSIGQRVIFLQVLLLSFLNSANIAAFLMMQYGVNWAWMSAFQTFSWALLHGIPAVIYLCLNRTIRLEVKIMMSQFCWPKDPKKSRANQNGFAQVGTARQVPVVWITQTNMIQN